MGVLLSPLPLSSKQQQQQQLTTRDSGAKNHCTPSGAMLEGWKKEEDPKNLPINEVLLGKSVGYSRFFCNDSVESGSVS